MPNRAKVSPREWERIRVTVRSYSFVLFLQPRAPFDVRAPATAEINGPPARTALLPLSDFWLAFVRWCAPMCIDTPSVPWSRTDFRACRTAAGSPGEAARPRPLHLLRSQVSAGAPALLPLCLVVSVVTAGPSGKDARRMLRKGSGHDQSRSCCPERRPHRHR